MTTPIANERNEIASHRIASESEEEESGGRGERGEREREAKS